MKRFIIFLLIFAFICVNAKSQDYWTPVNTGLFSTAILCLDQKEGLIFTGTEYSGIFKTTNNGGNWYWASNGLTDYVIQCLTTSGTNIFAGTRSGGINLSTNNGDNWIPVNNNLPVPDVLSLASNETGVFAGLNDRGIYFTTNNGSYWTPVNNGIPNGYPIISIATSGNNVYAATPAFVFLSTNNGTYWNKISGSISGIKCLKTIGTSIIVGTYSGHIYLSSNQGSNWIIINNGVPYSEILSINGKDNHIFVSNIDNDVYYSSNFGTNWTLVKSGLPAYRVKCFLISGNNIFAGTDGVYLHSGFNPTVTSTSISSITYSSASSGGNVTNDGGASVTARGVVWSTSANPTITNNLGISSDGAGTGSFTSSLTGLAPNTLYHVRAYATNSVATSYGEDLQFTSLVNYSTIITQSVTLILSQSVTGNGEITNTGGENATRRGFCFNTTGNPTISDSKVEESGNFSTGTFSLNLNGLISNTQYYVKAYAENSIGLSYGNEVTFRTLNNENFKKLSFQGQLTDFNGINLPDGQYPIIFKFYTEMSGQGVPIWQEQQLVILNNGIFSVILGSVVPIDLPFNTSYYLGVTVLGQEELSPRFPLVGPVYQNGGFGR